MSNGSRIRVIGPSGAADAQETPAETVEEPFTLSEEWAEEVEDVLPTRSYGWIVPVLAALAITIWSGFFGWANRADMLAGGTPQQWSSWIVAWSVPVLLVVVLWILAQRNSRREAARFGKVAKLLSEESTSLEARLSVVNRELSLAREFLGSQSRELDSLGRIASERIAQHAVHLQSLIQTNGEQVNAIATVSTTAVENMARLRDDLPVIANSAKDVSNQIGSAGRSAHGQIDELVSGFRRLNEFGQASERQVSALQGKIDAALAEFETHSAKMEEITGARFDNLRATSESFRAELDVREVEALAALRRRADVLAEEVEGTRAKLEEEEEQALVSLRARLGSLREESSLVSHSVKESQVNALSLWGEQVDGMKARLTEAVEEISAIDRAALEASQRKLRELAAEAQRVDEAMLEHSNALHENIESRRAQLAAAEQEALEALMARLNELDASILSRQDSHLAQTAQLAEHGEAITQRLATMQCNLEHLGRLGSETNLALGESAASLNERLEQSRASVTTTASAIHTLTEDTVRLLELIQASAQHSQVDLPAAIGEAGNTLTITEERVNQLQVMLKDAGDKGADLSAYVIGARAETRDAISEIEAFHAHFGGSTTNALQEVERLKHAMAELSAAGRQMADSTKTELCESIALLEQAAGNAVGALHADAAANIAELAERIGKESSDAIERALRGRTIEAVAQLEVAAAKAADAGRDAAIQLRDQLGKVNELAGNLEARVSRARHRAEEQIDNDFSRRVALITESLNSNAIDISKAISSDVTDTAWASYLRGDRGIFTRRAVRLLENSEAREIAEVYAQDSEFSENVSRYIHDFEAMLRAMLSTRDGNALAVTLLSSDMGKLYVALAQAIERLRS